MRRWTEEHGEDGLRDKFSVYKTKDITPSGKYPDLGTVVFEDRIGADGEFIFVLRPETDCAAWGALADYAKRVRSRAPKLASDIERELLRIHSEEASRA